MYTINEIAQILDSAVINGHNQENKVINDFEYLFDKVNSSQTAFISISETSWQRYLNKTKVLTDGKLQINKDHKEIGLIITEEYISDLRYNIPQILVENSIDAMKKLALFFRENYKKPVVCLTGSMGKTSTRLMLKAGLEPLKVLDNRGNSNTRSAIYLHMCKLASNPDIALFEVSLNALNNRGNMSKLLKPDIAILTGIGAAHLSTISTTKDIASFKVRIFEGLNQEGIAIYNKDTLHNEYIKNMASKNTNNIYSYSLQNPSSDITLLSVEHIKKGVKIKIKNREWITCPFISDGLLQNLLGVILVLEHLKINITTNTLEKIANVTFLRRVLEFKEIKDSVKTVTLLDDTHNASLPAMLNALSAFESQAPFFKGNKVIALGQISDLGDRSEKVHNSLVKALENASADYILCMDEPLKKVVSQVKSKQITWYTDYRLMLLDLCRIANNDSLFLLKSSVTGTNFPEIAKQLPLYVANDINNNENSLYPPISMSYIIVKIDDMSILKKYNIENSSTIEGLAPILYYIRACEKKLKNKVIELKTWPTNNKTFHTGKALEINYIIEIMRESPHPSLIYQLAYELYKGANSYRKEDIKHIVSVCNLNPSAFVNVTGRFRNKERQCFTVEDLFKLVKEYTGILLNQNKFILGQSMKHGFITRNDKMIIFTGAENIESVLSIIENF